MKYLAILGGCVLLIISAWLIVRRHQAGVELPPDELKVEGGGTPIPRLDSSELRDNTSVQENAHALLEASRNRPQAAHCIQHLRMLTESLSDPQWNVAAPDLLAAWRKLRTYPEALESLSTFEGKVLDRFARSGSLELLGSLVRISSEANGTGDKVSASLEALTRVPIRSYRDSRVALLVAAALEAKELGRAKGYLGAISWEPGAAGVDRVVPEQIAEMLGVALGAPSGKADLAKVVHHWGEAKKGALAQDAISRDAVLRLLTGIGSSAVRTTDAAPDGPKFSDLVRQSAGEPEAATYWSAVASDLAAMTDAPAMKTGLLAALFKAYLETFGRCPEECGIWLELARHDSKKPKRQLHQKFQSIDWLQKALAAARGDGERVDILNELKSAYQGIPDLRTARKVLSEAVPSIADPLKREEVSRLVRGLDEMEEARAKRATEQESKLHQGRIAGQLAHMKDRLEDAKKTGKPAADVQSLEAVVKELELELTALKK